MLPRCSPRAWFGALCCLAALGRVAAPAATASAAESAAAAALVEGSLPNGLRHVLLPHSDRAAGISLQLIVHAGSLDEREDERGYAHFVEHMAFNGTRHYPAGKLVEFFERLGLGFGRHATATTSFTSTIYRIDLPASQTTQLAAALEVLRDFADGIRFEPAEVRRERGVMLSELRARDDDDFQTELQRLRFYHEGTPVAARSPRGDPQCVRRADAARLRAFYDRCYRPRRMTLLAVGDLSADAFAALAATHFGTLAARGADVPQIRATEPAARGLRARVIHAAKSRAASVTLATLALSPAGAPDDEQAFAESIVLRIMDRRLDERRVSERPRYGYSAATRSRQIDGAFRCRTLELHSRIADWSSAVGAIEVELRRAKEQGFSSSEVAEAGAVLLAQLRRSRDEFAGATPRERGAKVAAALAAHRRWRGPAERLAAAERFVPRFTPALAAETLRRSFSADRLDLVLLLPPDVAATEPALQEAWRRSAAQPLAAAPIAAAPAAELKFRYTGFGPAGAVVEHRTEPDVSLHAVRFGNGVRLSLRPSTSEPRSFRLTARIGSGVADVPPDKPGLGLLAVLLLGSADLNRHSSEDVGRLIRLHGLNGDLHISNGEFTVSFEGPVDSLPFILRYLAAFLSDVKLEPARLTQALSLYASQHGAMFGATNSTTNAESVFLLAGGDPRLQFPPPSGVKPYPFEFVAEWIRAHWLNGPLEIGLAGDFDVAEVITAAAATVGALPERTQPPDVANAPDLALQTKPFRRLSTQRLPDRAATVRVLWPAAAAADPRVHRSLSVAAEVLEDRIQRIIREQRGATYSPSVIVSRSPVAPAFAVAVAEFTCTPREAGSLADQIVQLADKLACDGISAEEFARLREPLITRATESLRANAWWAENVLPYAQSHPDVVADARALGRIYQDLTRDEVNRAAAEHFRRGRASICGVLPGKP